MFLKPLNRDFNEREMEMLDLHFQQVSAYLEEFIIPEVISFYIWSGFSESRIYEDSLDIYISAVLSQFFNYEVRNLTVVRRNTIKMLRIKYNLEMVSTDPIQFKKAISDKKIALSDIKI